MKDAINILIYTSDKKFLIIIIAVAKPYTAYLVSLLTLTSPMFSVLFTFMPTVSTTDYLANLKQLKKNNANII